MWIIIRAREVVDYDYKGTYESRGYSDEADIPECTLSSTTPPFEVFNIILGNTTHSVITLSNSTIGSFNFDTLRKQICFDVTGSSNTAGYCYVTIPKELLWCDSPEQWQVWVNNTLIEDRIVVETANYTYIYFTYNHSIREVQIIGTHAAPPPVGCIWIPVNKLELLAPWIGLVSVLVSTIVVSGIIVKRKRKQQT